MSEENPLQPEPPRPEKKPEGKKEKKLSRDLQVIYRTSTRNHVSMSAIADRKANILIGVTSILNSLAFSFLVTHVSKEPAYALPGLLLIVVCTVTAVLAILSTRPARAKGTFTRDEIRDQSQHVLFYGNFYKMPYDDYNWAMRELEKDPEYLREAIHRDMYNLGVAVAHKFRHLRWSYTIFMVGLVLVLLVGYLTFEYHIVWFSELFKGK